MTAITKIQIFSETIFLVKTFYGNACNAYREGRNANVLITLLGTVYIPPYVRVFGKGRWPTEKLTNKFKSENPYLNKGLVVFSLSEHKVIVEIAKSRKQQYTPYSFYSLSLTE